MDSNPEKSGGKCPFAHAHPMVKAKSNQDWWPNQVNLKLLHQNSTLSDPIDRKSVV